MTYTAVLSCNFGNYAPTEANVRIDVDSQTISSGITTIANTGGTAFTATVSTLSDAFRGPFVFYDSTDATKYCVGSVGPEHELLDVASSTLATASALSTAQADLDIITGADGVNLSSATQASIDAIEADTNELQTDDVPGLIAALNDLSAAEVNAEVDTALADYDGPTKAEMDTAHSTTDALISGLNDPTSAEIWTYVTRTLTNSATPTITSPIGADGKIIITRHASFEETVSASVTIPNSRTNTLFTVKYDCEDADSAALLQVDVLTGLLYVNGASGTAGDASLVVDDVNDEVDIVISDNASTLLPLLKNGVYDIKVLKSDGESVIIRSGKCDIVSAVTITI